MSTDAETVKADRVKVDKWDGNAVKNSLDDAVKAVLMDKYKYTERFLLVDLRLAICTVAVLLALAAIIWDYLHPFPVSKPVLLVCACSYFVMSGILTLYSMFVEKNIFFVALKRDPAGIDPDISCHVSSKLPRYDDKYTLHMCYKDAGGRQRESSVVHSVAQFIDTEGVIVRDKVEPVVTRLHNGLTASKKDK